MRDKDMQKSFEWGLSDFAMDFVMHYVLNRQWVLSGSVGSCFYTRLIRTCLTRNLPLVTDDKRISYEGGGAPLLLLSLQVCVAWMGSLWC